MENVDSIHEWEREGFVISTDKRRVDIGAVHAFLSSTYWATGIPLAVVERAIQHSCVFGVYEGNQQVGFARVITDYATNAYLSDVFILPAYRGKGLARWLVETIVSHPDLQGFRRWMLATRDAHGLYRKVGFTELAAPERWMERWRPNVYAEADT